MIRFIVWRKNHKSGFAYPVSRKEAWEYVNRLKDTAAGGASASGFLEAIRFCQHVLGLRDVESIFSSKHISGLADQMFPWKSVWSLADVLTIEQVLLLHEFAERKQFNQVDGLAACHFLHALYSRNRWSDFRHVHEILIDFDETHVGYLEVRTRKHKTARNADKKSKLLPVVAPTLGSTLDHSLKLGLSFVFWQACLPRVSLTDLCCLPLMFCILIIGLKGLFQRTKPPNGFRKFWSPFSLECKHHLPPIPCRVLRCHGARSMVQMTKIRTF